MGVLSLRSGQAVRLLRLLRPFGTRSICSRRRATCSAADMACCVGDVILSGAKDVCDVEGFFASLRMTLVDRLTARPPRSGVGCHINFTLPCLHCRSWHKFPRGTPVANETETSITTMIGALKGKRSTRSTVSRDDGVACDVPRAPGSKLRT